MRDCRSGRRDYRQLEDGYIVAQRWDRGWVYIEGIPCSDTDRFLTAQERRNFNACLKRRGLPPLANTRE